MPRFLLLLPLLSFTRRRARVYIHRDKAGEISDTRKWGKQRQKDEWLTKIHRDCVYERGRTCMRARVCLHLYARRMKKRANDSRSMESVYAHVEAKGKNRERIPGVYVKETIK